MDVLPSPRKCIYNNNIQHYYYIIIVVPPRKLKSFLFTFIFYDFNKVRFIIVI